MAIAKIEPTGCCVRKGRVQLRFNFYLEPDDPRYKEHHIRVPIIPSEGYQGEVDGMGNPVDQAHYNAWVESLPKKWQNNPFHNHFVYIDSNDTDVKIRQLIVESLEEFYGIWSRGEDILKVWKPKGRLVAGDMSQKNIKRCEARVKDIKNRASEFEYRRGK